MTPSVGRIVHYLAVNPNGYPKYVCQSALIAEVPHLEEGEDPDPGAGIGLWVFAPHNLAYIDSVPETDRACGWHWPERVE